MDNERPDPLIFAKECNSPIFIHNSQGSIFSIMLNPAGDMVVAGGNAVHARTMGSWGFIYSIHSH